MAVDPLNRSPLKPFALVEEMVSRTQKIFNSLDGELAGGFKQMDDLISCSTWAIARAKRPAGINPRQAGRIAVAVHFQ